MPTVHLICGLPAAGKSTYAGRLEAETGGVLFTLDRWLITAFGHYTLADIDDREHVRRVLACRDLIWMAAAAWLARGVDVIFDDGYFLRDHRAVAAGRAGRHDAAARVHFVDTPIDVIRRRLTRRNASLPDFNFAIDPSVLERCVAIFERPAPGEPAELRVVTAASLDNLDKRG